MKVYRIQTPSGQSYYTNRESDLTNLPQGSTLRVEEMSEEEYRKIPASSDSERFFTGRSTFVTNPEKDNRGMAKKTPTPPQPRPRMSDEEYNYTQARLELCAQLFEDLDFVGFLERATIAETVGPFVANPQMYQNAAPPLQKVREMADHASRLRASFRELQKLREAVHARPTH